MNKENKRRKNRKTQDKLSSKKGTSSPNKENVSDIDKSSIVLKDILKKKWKVYRVSPIYNFKKDKLKMFENKLSRELELIKNNYSNVSCKTYFTFNENIQINDSICEVLKVQVMLSQSKSTYLGYFISSNYNKENLQDCISLPLLLVEAKEHATRDVHFVLCKIFDCDIQPITFSFCNLVTFLVKLLETPQTDSSEEMLHLDYKIPGCPAQDSIRVSLIMVDITVILAMIIDHLREKVQGITNMEIILEFYNRILNHFYNIYKLDLMQAELQKVIFSFASITLDGQVKISKHDAAQVILSVLQKICKPIQQF